MSVLVIQHLEPERPCGIAASLAAVGLEVELVRTDLGHGVPATVEGRSGLVVLGGPMSAMSDIDFPTRTSEVAILADALERGVPVLGVCLGAQLLAVAAGGRVRPGNGPEIGWAPVDLIDQPAPDPLFGGLGPSLVVLHWHGETYDLPPDAVQLAASASYEQQAFRMGAVAWGLQFHLEVDRPAVERFVEAFPDDAARAPGGAARILGDTESALASDPEKRALVLDRFSRICRLRTSTGAVAHGHGGS